MYRLITFIIILCMGLFAEDVLPTCNVWSGREQPLPFVANDGWRVEAEHGRLLAQGRGKGAVKLSFPALKGKETATLFVDGMKVARLTIQPEKLLEGVVAECRVKRAELEHLGVKSSTDGASSCCFMELSSLEQFNSKAKVVVFCDRRDFPLNAREEWVELNIGIDRRKGPLGIVLDGRERAIDNSNGGVAWIVAKNRNGGKIILLPYDFDLENVDNILFLKKELEK